MWVLQNGSTKGQDCISHDFTQMLPAAAAEVQGVHALCAQPWHMFSFGGVCPRPDSRDAFLVEVLQSPLPCSLPQCPTALIHLPHGARKNYQKC